MSGLYERAYGSKLPQIGQDQRICSVCGVRFLSGVMVIELSYSTVLLCKLCNLTQSQEK